MKKFGKSLNSHWTWKGGYRMVAKKVFETKEDAELFIEENKMKEKYHAYRCDVCKKYHVGHKKNK